MSPSTPSQSLFAWGKRSTSAAGLNEPKNCKKVKADPARPPLRDLEQNASSSAQRSVEVGGVGARDARARDVTLDHRFLAAKQNYLELLDAAVKQIEADGGVTTDEGRSASEAAAAALVKLRLLAQEIGVGKFGVDAA